MPLVPFNRSGSARDARGTKRAAKVPQKTGGTRYPDTAANGSSPRPAPRVDGNVRGHYPGRPSKHR